MQNSGIAKGHLMPRIILLLIFFLLTSQTMAIVVVNLSDRGDGGLRISWSGTDTATVNKSDDTLFDGFELDFDTFAASVDGDPFSDIVSGGITNNTQGLVFTAINNSGVVDHDGGDGQDDLRIFFTSGNGLTANAGDSLSFNVVYEFTPGNVAFSEVVLSQNFTSFNRDFAELTNGVTVQVSVVPEPSTCILLLLAALGFSSKMVKKNLSLVAYTE